MAIEVTTTPHFDKLAKDLRKRYPNIWKDIEPLIEQLEGGQLPGDRLQRIDDHEAYKVRLPNRDAQRGKSGGYRVIYYVRTSEAIYLLEIYSKSDKEDISDAEVLTEIEDILASLADTDDEVGGEEKSE
jgi:mRNA-degrading endonuclease RelE of RelBE toxin-antitoxin system